MKQVNLFAEETQLERLSKLGDSLERLKIIDFESFRPILTDGLKKERKSNAGRHPFDNVMMFKVLVLEKLFNLSDDQTEYQITDRISFQRFLGLSLGEKVPDAKTIWVFKNTLTELGIIDVLFAEFKLMYPVSETAVMKTRKSRTVKFPRNGKMSRISCLKRTPMHVGRRKATKSITDIKITSRWMPTVS